MGRMPDVRRCFVALGLVAGLLGCSAMPQGSVRSDGDEPAVMWGENSGQGAVYLGDGDEEPVAKIVNGTLDNGHPCVGMLTTGSSLCSATLIGKRTVITAQHCVGSGGLSFSVGGNRYPSSRAIPYPGWRMESDIALVILSQEPTGVSPCPINIDQVRVGQTVTLVGFGVTGELSGGAGTKRMGQSRISSVDGTTFSIPGGGANVCNGDSGGPSFQTINGQERVVGVHSTKSGFCGMGGTDIRVDAFKDWIQQSAGGDVVLPGSVSPNPQPNPQPPTPTNSPQNSSPAAGQTSEGQSCVSAACKKGLACTTVFTSDNVTEIGRYCMEQCQNPGAFDSACDGGERCTQSRTAGAVCFNPSNAAQGFTDPDAPATPSTPATPQQPQNPSPGDTASEGQSCADKPCAPSLACTTVFGFMNSWPVGKYCMEVCQSPGAADSACDGGESCIQSRTAGPVCFDPSNEAQGFTRPGGSPPSTPSTPSTPATPSNPGTGTDTAQKEQKVLELTNADRAQRGLGALTLDALASNVARAHSADMCQRRYFSHVNLNGEEPWDRLRRGGVQFGGAGENIAKGQRTPEEVHRGFMGSAGHRANLLGGQWKRMGVGYAPCSSGALWTEVFMD